MDFVANKKAMHTEFQDPSFEPFRSLDPADTYSNADLEKAFRKLADPLYTAKTVPSTVVPTNVGNSYTASVYSSLLSLLSSVPQDTLVHDSFFFLLLLLVLIF